MNSLKQETQRLNRLRETIQRKLRQVEDSKSEVEQNKETLKSQIWGLEKGEDQYYHMNMIRDWSLIRGRGGATKWENRGSETYCVPPPSRQGKTFCALPPPPFEDWKLFAPPAPFNMAKTSSYRVKTTPTFCKPPPPPL